MESHFYLWFRWEDCSQRYSFHWVTLDFIQKLLLLCITKILRTVYYSHVTCSILMSSQIQLSYILSSKHSLNRNVYCSKWSVQFLETATDWQQNPLYVCLLSTIVLQHNAVGTGKLFFRVTGLFVSGTNQSPVLTMVCDVELLCFYVSVYKLLKKLLSCRWCSRDTTAMIQSVLSKVSQLWVPFLSS